MTCYPDYREASEKPLIFFSARTPAECYCSVAVESIFKFFCRKVVDATACLKNIFLLNRITRQANFTVQSNSQRQRGVKIRVNDPCGKVENLLDSVHI